MAKNQTSVGMRIVNIVFCVLFGLCAVVDFAWVYWKFFVDKPTTTNAVYVQTVTDQYGNEQNIIQLNYYSNSNNTGEEVMEIQLNYYTDAQKTAVQSTTIQATLQKFTVDGLNFEIPKITYYSGGYGSHFIPVQEIQRNEPMYVEIEGEMYSFRLDRTYRELLKSVNIGKAVVGFFNELFGGNSGTDYAYDYYYGPEKEFTFDDFIIDCWQSLTQTSEGYGDFNLYLVDLSKYFTFYKYNEDTKQDDPYQVDATFVRNYFSVKAHVDRFGLTRASQSLVNMFHGDATYNTSGIGEGQEYWASRVNYYLTNDNFEYRSSATNGGYVLTLKQDTFAYLSKFDNLDIYVILNLDEFRVENINIVGLDEYALFGFNVADIKITSSMYTTFKFLNYSLYDTNLKTITHSNCITISMAENAINAVYEEVVI